LCSLNGDIENFGFEELLIYAKMKGPYWGGSFSLARKAFRSLRVDPARAVIPELFSASSLTDAAR